MFVNRVTDWGLLSVAKAVVLICLITPSVAPNRAADTPVSTPNEDAPELLLGTPISGEIVGGASRSYTLRLSEGLSFRVLVERGDLKVSLTLYEPGGSELGEFSRTSYGPLRIAQVTQAAGTYRVRINSREAKGVTGGYRLSLEDVHQAADPDRQADAASSAFYEAERLRAEWTESSIRAAIQKYAEAINNWSAATHTHEVLDALESSADAQFTLSDYKQALHYYQKALALSQTAGDRTAKATALTGIGSVYAHTGRDDQALAQFKLAAAGFEGAAAEAGNAESLRAEALALCYMGEVYYSRGDLNQAQELSVRALTLWTEAGDRSGQAQARLNSGHAYVDSGDTEKASEQFEQALSLWRDVGDRRGEALALTATGGIHSFHGRKYRALEVLQQALAMFRLIGDRHGEALGHNGVARSYEELNELELALDNYSQAVDLFHQNNNTEYEAVTRYCIGRIYRWMNQPDAALRHYEESIALSRQVNKRRMEAYALMDIATLHVSQNEPDRALSQFAKVMRFYRAIGDRRSQAKVLNSIGDIRYNAGDGRRALWYYGRALPLYQKAKDSNGEAATFYNLARAARASGDNEVALRNIQPALQIIDSLRVQIASPAFRSSYFGSVRKYYGFYIDLLMQLHKERPAEGFAALAFQASENARARVLLETLTESQADLRQGVSPELLQRERSLQQLLSTKSLYLSRLLSKREAGGESDAVASELRQLTAEYQELQARIRAESPRYAGVTQQQPLSVQDIQQQLGGNDTLLLEYALGDERSYLWAVSAEGFESAELEGRATLEKAADDIYTLLRAYAPLRGETEEARQARIAEADGRYWERAAQLSQLLFGRLAEKLGNKRLLIVADGALQYIPFEALPVPLPANAPAGRGDPRPMVLEHEISSLPSASALVALRREEGSRGPARGVVAVLADPVFEPDDPRVRAAVTKPTNDSGGARPATGRDAALRGVLRDDDAARLPFTRREAEAIISLIPADAGRLASGFDANLSTVMSPEFGDYEVLHFATHGVFNNKNPESSGLLLSLVDQSGNPQNGFLHLQEIYGLNLSAKLVVLSGCDTGLGKDVNGEGLVGLTHAFMYAGTKSIVASLWKVEDKATHELMTRFYKGMLRDGLSPSVALRAAKIEMWKQQSSRPPYYWAAFVLTGEFRQKIAASPYKQSPPSRVVPLMLLLSGAALASWGGFRLRRRLRKPVRAVRAREI